jgi:anthraniloyl-CoA monooxygenase
MRRVAVIGGGPAGLYAALLLKKIRPRLDVEVIERNPAGATYGWGVVFSDRTLTEFREADQTTFEAITDRFVVWDAIDIRYRGELVRSGGHVFAGISRVALLGILQGRCRDLGVRLGFEQEVADPGALGHRDLVIAADGVNSLARESRAKEFRPRKHPGASRYIWFGTDRVLDSFTFVFRQSDHGLFQAHAYPFDGATSTWIVETDEDTWRRAGLDRAGEGESIAYCERLFSEELRGRRLMSNRSQWISFVTLRNRTWRSGNLVLLGDAAHTAHFSIGSGTKLAMEDAIALARAVDHYGDDVEAALNDYELERRPLVERFQEAAEESRTYFEHTSRYLHLEPMEFAFHLLTRSGRIDYASLRLRDPRYVDEVDRAFAARGKPHPAPRVAPPPLFTPIDLGSRALPNRVVTFAQLDPSARGGSLSGDQARSVADTGGGAAGLVLTDIVSVSARGRATPGNAGLYTDEHVERWRRALDDTRARGAGLVAVQIGHAGRRGATRPRRRGIDRPLPEGGWPVLAPSPIPLSPRSPIPEEMLSTDLDLVRKEFAGAAARAAGAGFDVLVVHMARGYLLHTFLSPGSNAREDGYGGSAGSRMRYPLEVFEAVRAAWPEDRPLGAVIPATDWTPGGWDLDDAVALAGALRDRGCDLVEPVAGGLTPHERPRYGNGRAFLAEHSDRVRNEAHIATLTGGHITTTDLANTLLAGGRADLCVMTPP